MASKIENSPEWYQQLEIDYIEAIKRKDALDEEIKDLRSRIQAAMFENKKLKINTCDTKVVVIDEYSYRTIDSELLRVDHPDIYRRYSSQHKIAEHLQIQIKSRKNPNRKRANRKQKHK